MQKIRHILMLSILLSLSAVTWASVIPQTGLWSIVPESTGKPGRGLAIDVQGDTLILTVYGYTKEGRATFYLASGPYADGKFSGELGMYGGGTAFGGKLAPAQYLGSAGKVNLTFSSESAGMVTLPGEQAKPISRFVTKALNLGSGAPIGQFFEAGNGLTGDTVIQSYAFTDSKLTLKDGYFGFKYSIIKNQNTVTCELSGDYYQSGSKLASNGNYTCSDNTHGTYRVTNLEHFSTLEPSWSVQYYYSGQFYFKPHDSENETLYVMKGIDWLFSEIVPGAPPYSYRPVFPQNGLWWVAAESQGFPGRGFSLDTQGNTLVLTFFGYDEEGNSTFYIASGEFDSYREGFSAWLLENEGGTAFGEAYTPAEVIRGVGIVKLKFTTDIDGVITLPGGLEQPIKRFTAYDASKHFVQGTGKFSGFYNFEIEKNVLKSNGMNYEFSMHNARFELKTVAQSEKTNTECIYSGTYETSGTILSSEGRYKCTSSTSDPNYIDGPKARYSEGKYWTTDLIIDAPGVFSGNFRHYDGYLGRFIETKDGNVWFVENYRETYLGGQSVK